MVMAVVTRTCEGCGVQFTFTVKPARYPRRFCNQSCYANSQRHKDLIDARRKTEKYKALRKKYHQTDKDKATNKKYRQSDLGRTTNKKYRQSHKRIVWTKEYEKSNKVKTRRKNYRQTDSGRVNHLKIEQGRRARKRDAFVEDVDVRVLLDLQGGVCFLCSQSISLDIKHPDPMSLSLDHITPLVKGGSHSYENCAATHLRCNLVKGVKSVEDVAPLLRLVS
jgi:hypothetical protein